MNRLCLPLLLIASIGAAEEITLPDIVPLPHAHAHNDYLHQRPLHDALSHGFCSVEADIFLVDGRLLVAHSRNEIKPDRSLQSLYLEPLRVRVAAGQGRVFPNGPGFTLLIDIKSDAASTYAALRKVLAEYADILTVTKGEAQTAGAVTVVISGNRAQDRIANDAVRYAGIDGRLEDLDSQASRSLVPLISDNWSRHFSWSGSGPMPVAQRQKLREIVTKAHHAGRRVRLWATPEDPRVWNELLDAGVDLIGTDDLEQLSQFLNRRQGR